jgi:hypothetical protein
MTVDDMVIAINETDQVVNLASRAVDLQHCEDHLRAVSHLPQDSLVVQRCGTVVELHRSAMDDGSLIADHIIQFFDQDGEELQLVIFNSEHELRFVASASRLPGRRIALSYGSHHATPFEGLRCHADVHRINASASR